MNERNTMLILWPKFDSCEQMRYGREICSALSKFYGLFFKSDLDSMSNINLLLLYSFLISFIGFIVAVTISFFEPNQNVLRAIELKAQNFYDSKANQSVCKTSNHFNKNE